MKKLFNLTLLVSLLFAGSLQAQFNAYKTILSKVSDSTATTPSGYGAIRYNTQGGKNKWQFDNGAGFVDFGSGGGNLTGAITSSGLATSLGSFTSNALGTAISDPVRTVTGTDAIVQADNGRTIYFNSATPFNFTIDALTINTFTMFRNIGTATVSFVDGSGVTSTGATALLADEVGGIEYIASTTPIISVAGGGGNLTGDVTSVGNATSIASGVIVNADINASAAIDATKLIDGSITNTELGYINTLTSDAQTQLTGKQPIDSDLTTIAGLTATTDNFIQAKSSAWASRTPAQVKADLNVLYLPLITGYLGSSGSDASMETATAVDRIPTTSMSVGQRISAIVTISGTQRRLYSAELVVPADATANIEVSPSVIRPNDFNASTNNKVWREIKNSGIIDVSNYGVVPGAIYVSSQINAIITAASSNDALIFPPGDYNVYAMNIDKKLTFQGYGARFISPALDVGVFSVTQDGVVIRGFDFIGQGRGAAYPNQRAIRISNCSNVRIEDCLFDGYPDSAVSTNSTHHSDTSGDYGGINIVNCIFMRNDKGFHAITRGEYVTITGSSIVDNDTGLLIGAGNILVTGNNIADNVIGLDFVTGVNDAHGQVSNNQINHNGLSIRATDLVFGEFFRGNNIYEGDMEFTDCAGIEFTNNTIDFVVMQFDNCTGVKVEHNNFPVNGNLSLVTDWNGNQSQVFAYNNKNFDNEYASGWNDAALAIPNSLVIGDSLAGATSGFRLDVQGDVRVEETLTIATTPASDESSESVLVYSTSGDVSSRVLPLTHTTDTKKGSRTQNLGVLGSAGTSSSSIHVNTYYSNKTTLVARVTVVAIKTDGTASAHATVTCRFRKDNSGTFTADDTGIDVTSDITILADVVGEINGTNPSIKVTMGAASGDYEVSWTAETIEVKN